MWLRPSALQLGLYGPAKLMHLLYQPFLFRLLSIKFTVHASLSTNLIIYFTFQLMANINQKPCQKSYRLSSEYIKSHSSIVCENSIDTTLLLLIFRLANRCSIITCRFNNHHSLSCVYSSSIPIYQIIQGDSYLVYKALIKDSSYVGTNGKTLVRSAYMRVPHHHFWKVK